MTLDGARPQSVSVSLSPETTDDTTYVLGDVILVAVEFDKNVTVRGSPVLVLDCRRMREALFHGGNDSTTLVFEYEVWTTVRPKHGCPEVSLQF